MKSSHFPSLNISKPGCNSLNQRLTTPNQLTNFRMASSNSTASSVSPAFTIVELLIVIVVIGILAAITIVSYTGITHKADEATLKSDLTNNAKKLGIYYTQYGEYPHIDAGTGCPVAPSTLDSNYCLKFSPSNTFVYTYKTATTYDLTATRGDTTYKVTENTLPKIVASITCPTGFIIVPGSSNYGTSSFCIMKYDAKIYGNDVGTAGYSPTNLPSSRASGTPYVNISQTNAITQATKTVNQSGTTIANAHLTTEAEWLTVAQNVLGVASNWSGGAVGNGYIYRGHSDNAPANSLAASTDTDGYYGTGNSISSSPEQKRTLTLTNGEVIWDLAGNVWNWTSGQTSGANNQPGINGNGYFWRDWKDLTNPGNLTPNPSPVATGISGSSGWTANTNGIGVIYSDSDEVGLRGFIRGGVWNAGIDSGVLYLNLYNVPYDSYTYLGFRVSSSGL